MFKSTFGRWRRRRQQARAPRTRLHLEMLESRCVLSTLHLTPLVQVSGSDPFAACAPAGWPVNVEVEPQLAVDPTNPNHFVGVWSQDALGMVAGVSFNGGNSWQSVVIPGLTQCSGGVYLNLTDPWVSFAANGDVYVSVIGGTNQAILVSKSTDGGLTWGAPTTIVTVINDYIDKPSITADTTNARFAYASCVQVHGGRGFTMFSRTTDGGQTWEPARAIFDSGANNSDKAHQIIVLPNGTLVNFFSQHLKKSDAGGTSHFDFKLSLIRSSDRGQTWLPGNTPIPVADILPLDDTQAIPVPNPDGGLPIRALNWVFDVAVDPANGNLYAVWQDARFSNFQYNSIAFSMSTDGGLTWSAPIRVNQTPDNIPVGNRQAFIPSVAVAADGTVAVTYYDFRNNTSDPGLPTDYWMVHAHANTDLTNPASWASENRVTKDSFDMEQAHVPPEGGHFVGDYMGLSAAGNSFAALWAMPHTNPDGTIDHDSIFFRDPLPDEFGAVIGSRDPSQPQAPGGNSAPSSLVSFASGTLPLFPTIEVGTAPVMGNAGSSSEAARPSTLLSAVPSGLPTHAGDSGSGRRLLPDAAQRVSTDWDVGSPEQALVDDLIAEGIMAPLTSP